MSIYADTSEWRLSTNDGIPYKLLDGYPRGSYGEENATAEERYIIRASDLTAFVLESFPPMVTWEGTTLAFSSRRAMPGMDNLITRSISYEPLGQGKPCDPHDVDPGAPDKAYTKFVIVTIQYTTGKRASDANDPETFLEISAGAAGEFLMLPMRGAWTLHPGPNDQVQGANATFGQVIPEITWTVRWPQVPRAFLEMLVTTMRPLLGHVNTAAMPLLQQAPAGTILFMGFSFREQHTWRNGLMDSPPVEIEMIFNEKHLAIEGAVIGHNHFWREETGRFEQLFVGVEAGAGGRLVYPMADLNTMFPPILGA